MTFDEQLRRAFDTLTSRLHDDIRRQVQTAVDEALAVEPTRPADVAADHRLLDAVRALGRARSLSETLDTLARCAAAETHRAAVLTIRGGRIHGWRFIGFGALDLEPSIELSLDDAGIIASAARANAVTSGQHAPSFAEPPHGASCIALPIALGGEVVAVLYADSRTPDPESRLLNADALEILTRYAARGIEALTAFKVARSLTAAASTTGAPATAADEDEEAAARRYARLLVSEIKLYHGDSVAAGRRDRDLAIRLGGEISRARALYEQRVPSHVLQRARYFDDELVRTLAQGDATLLELRT
jgi:GAF domain-containing protein